jgi:hypothetical protein
VGKTKENRGMGDKKVPENKNKRKNGTFLCLKKLLPTIKIETPGGAPLKSPPCLSTRTAITIWTTAPLA